MSSESTLVTAQHFAYIAGRTRRDDDFLRNLKAEAAAAGIPQIWISPEQASFMRILLRLIRARHVVEVGTLAGYAAISLARALPQDGKLVTIEISADFASFARQKIAQSDVAGRVDVRLGDGRDLLPDIANSWADAMFLDADKGGYGAYLEHARRILRPQGMILVDNAFAFGQLFSRTPADRETNAVRAFNEMMAADPDFDSVIVPIGDGLWIGVRR